MSQNFLNSNYDKMAPLIIGTEGAQKTLKQFRRLLTSNVKLLSIQVPLHSMDFSVKIKKLVRSLSNFYFGKCHINESLQQVSGALFKVWYISTGDYQILKILLRQTMFLYALYSKNTIHN